MARRTAPQTGQERLRRRSLARSVFTGIACAAIVGICLFAFLGWRSISMQRAEPDEAKGRFDRVRQQLRAVEPLLRVEPDGRVTRRRAEVLETRPASRLRVLAYRPTLNRVVEANVPFWFLRAKGPAIRFSLRDTGLDLDQLGITPEELQRYGATLVLDAQRVNGDLLLVWTE